jgi:hypothetical protein
MTNLLIIFGLLILGYLVLYFTGRKYLETFDTTDRKPDQILNNTIYPPEKPYVTNSPILDLDDYEYSMVFQNEGTKEATKQQLNEAMSRYPLDWSVQPPDSQYFQDNQDKFLDEKQKELQSPPVDTSIFKQIDGSDMKPIDSMALDAEEKKILQTYKPESSKGLLSYSLDDVKQLVDKLYLKRGLIPTIEKSKQGGPNVYEIVEVQPKDPHIVWEDDFEKMTDRDRMKLRREEVIEVPYTVNDVTANLDPFFEPRVGVKDGKHDYTRFTPGLERMFAPTYPIKSWF